MIDRGQLLALLAGQNLWGGWKPETGVRRDALSFVEPLLEGKEALVIKGVRRCGKSWLLRQTMGLLLDRGIRPEEILHVRFDDPALAGHLDLETLQQIVKVYREEVYQSGKAWFLFDEIQYVSGWERFSGYVGDVGPDKQILTGSSSTLSSREIATALTGRNVSVELWPLSFRERLRFAGMDVPPERKELLGMAPALSAQAVQYLRWGGFPEVALATTEERKLALLKQYFEDILLPRN